MSYLLVLWEIDQLSKVGKFILYWELQVIKHYSSIYNLWKISYKKP